MRTVTGIIPLIISPINITFTLCDRYGNTTSVTDADVAPKQTISSEADGSFSISLYETEQSKLPIHYKISFEDNKEMADIKIFVHEGNEPIDFLKLLFPAVSLKMFYTETNGIIEFDESVKEIHEQFFVNENIFINNDEKNLIQEFVRFADDTEDNKIMEELDKYLATIGA